MNILKYSMIYKGYIITHNICKRARIVYDLESFIEIDDIYNILIIHINPDENLIENTNIFKIDETADLIPEGEYELYLLIYLNGVPFVTSKLLYESMVSIIYIDGSILNKDTVKKITNSKSNIVGDDHYLFLLRGGYFSSQDLETGAVSQKLSDEDLTDFFRSTNLLYPLEVVSNKANFWFHYFNKFSNKNFVSYDKTVYSGNKDDIYLSGAHYADLVIKTLQEYYKNIFFFNTSSDWGKDKTWKNIINNKKDFSEFVRYNVGAEDYSRARRDFHSNFGPVIYNVIVPIDFEYATSDTDIFLQRRTDLYVDQFMSYYTHDHFNIDSDLVGDQSNITGFAIHWIKDDMYSLEMNSKESNILDTNLSLHSMRFRAELYVRVLRFSYKVPPIMKIIVQLLKDEDTGESFTTFVNEATEEEKSIINKYYAEGKYLKEGQLVAMKNQGVDIVEEPVSTGENVEITNPTYKKMKN